MLSEKELSFMLLYPSSAHWFPLGMAFDEATGRTSIKPYVWSTVLHFVYVGCGGFMVLLGALRLFSADLFSIDLLLVYIFIFVTELTSWLVHLGFALWRHDLVALLNTLIQAHRAQGIAAPGSRRERILVLLNKGWAVTAFGGTMLALAGVEFQYYWAFHRSLGLGVPLAAALFMCAHSSCCWQIGGQLQMTMFLFSSLASDILVKNQNLPTNKDNGEREEEEDAGKEEEEPSFSLLGSILRYRALSIVCTMFNASYAFSTVPPVKYSLSFVVMGGLVGAIRLPVTDSLTLIRSLTILATAVYFFAILMLGTALSSSIWAMSIEWKAEYARKMENAKETQTQQLKYGDMLGKSILPIRFGVAGMYHSHGKRSENDLPGLSPKWHTQSSYHFSVK